VDRPTLADWMRPPGNTWSFRHVREIIPTARVAHDPARARPLAATPRDLSAVAVSLPAGDVPLDDYLAGAHTDAFVVLDEGALAYERYGAGVSPDDRHIVFSVTKSVTALVAGALIGEGLLDPAATVVTYVPETAGGGFGDARIRDLLDMTASIGFVEDYSPGPDVRAYREAAGWSPAPADAPGLHAFLAGRRPEGRHGERFRYLSPTTDMLGWTCERVAGRPLAECYARYVWGPMGAEGDGDVTVDRFGATRAAGGLCATARDMARIGQLVLDGGGDAIPASFVDELVTGGDPAAWAAGDYADFLPGAAYRSCWYQPAGGGAIALAIGIHGQLIYVDRDRRIVIAKQSSWPLADVEQADRDALAACEAIASALR
jgi:CubicO group peptidase (beta-lactamase class C family)